MCEHEWWVFSTITSTVELLVGCENCSAVGVVPEPTSDEWRRSFTAPDEPYPWNESHRVVLK